MPLHKAAVKGEWKKAKEFINLHSITTKITKGWERALHIAIAQWAKLVKFVEELIKLMELKDLAVPNKYGN